MLSQVSVMLAAFVATAALTPLVRLLAKKVQLVDLPDANRKLHREPMALGGGVAVLSGLLIALAFAFSLLQVWPITVQKNNADLWPLLVSAVLLCGLGLIDDAKNLRGKLKLLGQVGAALVVILAGLEVDTLHFFGWKMNLGPLALPFTLLWILGAINAVNLLDGSDGVATTVGIVLSLGLALMAQLTGHDVEAIVAIALAGSLIGFLLYNFPPASIFLGDAGSMVIGLLIGVLALRSSLKGPATVALAAPVAFCSIPFLDCTMAILRRKLTGRSLYTTDRGHLHHCLLEKGFSRRSTVLWIAVICGCTAAGALLSEYHKNELLAVISTAIVIGTLIATRIFGGPESQLLSLRLVGLLIRPLRKVREERIHMRGTRAWDDFWEALVELSERFEISALRLNLNIPAIHEEFHASRLLSDLPDPAIQWRAELPLIAQGRSIGRIHLSGPFENAVASPRLGEMLELIEELVQTLPIEDLGLSDAGPERQRDHLEDVNGSVIALSGRAELNAPANVAGP